MKSFPFDSEVTYDLDGNPVYDRGANSSMLADFLHLMFSDGVFPNPSTGLQVTASSSEMCVLVKPGSVMINGRMGIEESERMLAFNSADTTYDRIDAVVARLNTNHDYRDIDLYIVKGQEASTPIAPDLTRTGGIYELRLANVFIPKGTTVISAERITDTRLNTDECGIVVANPQNVDTTSIFNQYQAALEVYLQYVEECLDETTAGNLQNQITEILTTIGNTDISDIGDGTVKGAIAELKKSVSDGKTAVAAAITEQGVATDSDASFETMASNVTAAGTARYNAGVTATKVGTAGTSHVLKGKTFTNSSTVGATGTMPDYSANVQTVTPSASQTGTAEFDIADGYHIKIKVNAANVYNAGKTAGASGKVTPSYANLGTATDASANAKTLTIGASTRAVIMVMCYGDDSARGVTSVTSSAGTLSKMSSYNNGKTGTNYTVTELYLLSNATSGATITVKGAWNKVMEAYRITA